MSPPPNGGVVGVMGRKFGFSFSWRRASGLSAMKGRISRQIGIPLTRSGRERKVGRVVGGLGLPLLLFGAGRSRSTHSRSENQPGCVASFISTVVGLAVIAIIVCVIAAIIINRKGNSSLPPSRSPSAPAPEHASMAPQAKVGSNAAPHTPGHHASPTIEALTGQLAAARAAARSRIERTKEYEEAAKLVSELDAKRRAAS